MHNKHVKYINMAVALFLVVVALYFGINNYQKYRHEATLADCNNFAVNLNKANLLDYKYAVEVERLEKGSEELSIYIYLYNYEESMNQDFDKLVSRIEEGFKIYPFSDKKISKANIHMMDYKPNENQYGGLAIGVKTYKIDR